jgi:hypothetical protein
MAEYPSKPPERVPRRSLCGRRLAHLPDRICFEELTNYPEAGFGCGSAEWGKLWTVPKYSRLPQ